MWIYEPTRDSVAFFCDRLNPGVANALRRLRIRCIPAARLAVEEFSNTAGTKCDACDRPGIHHEDGRLVTVGEARIRRLAWTSELVERFWDGFEQTRLTEYAFARQGGKSLVIAIEHHLPPDGRVLDYGAGDGALTELLLDRGYRVAAYEPSGGRRDRLVARLAERKGFLGVVGPETREQFDVVLMIEVIEHILDEELDQELRRVHGVLKGEGTLIVTTPNNEDLELGMAYCPVSETLFHRWQHVRSFTAESLSALLRRHKIAPVVVHHVEFRSDLFLPFDRRWAGDRFAGQRPSHLEALRADIPVRIGSESNILFVGRKSEADV